MKLEVIELKVMEQQIAVVKADELEDALTRNGKVAIYGILFDFDKADIKPESKPQIDLSQRRAQSIVNALAASGIAANRLTPAGAGMVAPVATNRTEEGRAKNRRVEIVERVTTR